MYQPRKIPLELWKMFQAVESLKASINHSIKVCTLCTVASCKTDYANNIAHFYLRIKFPYSTNHDAVSVIGKNVYIAVYVHHMYIGSSYIHACMHVHISVAFTLRSYYS